MSRKNKSSTSESPDTVDVAANQEVSSTPEKPKTTKVTTKKVKVPAPARKVNIFNVSNRQIPVLLNIKGKDEEVEIPAFGNIMGLDEASVPSSVGRTPGLSVTKAGGNT